MVITTFQFQSPQQSNFIEPAQELLSTVAESTWSQLRKSPYACLEGLFWGTTSCFALYECYGHVRELARFSLQDLRCREGRERIQGEIKATVNAFFGLFGYSTYSLEWADRMRLITLGKLASLVQKISCTALFVNASFGVDKCLETIKKKKCAILNESDPVARSAHEHHYRAALLDLASHISTIAWACLGLVKLFFAVAVSPILTSAVLMVSSVFAITAFSYGIYIAVKLDSPKPEEASA